MRRMLLCLLVEEGCLLVTCAKRSKRYWHLVPMPVGVSGLYIYTCKVSGEPQYHQQVSRALGPNMFSVRNTSPPTQPNQTQGRRINKGAANPLWGPGL